MRLIILGKAQFRGRGRNTEVLPRLNTWAPRATRICDERERGAGFGDGNQGNVGEQVPSLRCGKEGEKKIMARPHFSRTEKPARIHQTRTRLNQSEEL